MSMTLTVLGIGVGWVAMNWLASRLSSTPSLFWLLSFSPIISPLIIGLWLLVKLLGKLGLDLGKKLREGQVAAEKAAILRGIHKPDQTLN